jgi:hypothetical protein
VRHGIPQLPSGLARNGPIMPNMNAVQHLLRHSIDYAGLFPPAGLDMQPAVSNYAEYSRGPDRWALGRFILPVSRFPEFAEAAQQASANGLVGPWRLSALTAGDLAADLDAISRFNERGQGVGVIDTIELKAGTARAIQEAIHVIPDDLQAYFEVPLIPDPHELISSLAGSGARVKVRTGGVTSDAFPESADLARFIGVCIKAQVPFKATAGLHHAFRAEYPLTYERGSPKGLMFGFLNLFLSTAFVRGGMSPGDAVQVLEETSLATIQANEDSIGWQDHRLDLEAISRCREAIVSFGSCSFTEPIGELQALQLVNSRVQRA